MYDSISNLVAQTRLNYGQVKFRTSIHLVGEIRLVSDYEFPPKEQLSYHNPIVGFMHYSYYGVNVIMKDGRKS
jgi:hypothetical protein